MKDPNFKEFRFVHLLPDKIVDLADMCIIDNNFRETGIRVRRSTHYQQKFEKASPISIDFVDELSPFKLLMQNSNG